MKNKFDLKFHNGYQPQQKTSKEYNNQDGDGSQNCVNNTNKQKFTL